ncbi:hypothetical protein [Pseudodesulfovibrio indicus]|uniref:hypothetical protein n=1 Tax=Pseudodesulfovibrio indicus TaxID=1716143 RepID=UPI00292E9AEE|nr:hypothetical protein [Pseudodesulfovibrio indicus]
MTTNFNFIILAFPPGDGSGSTLRGTKQEACHIRDEKSGNPGSPWGLKDAQNQHLPVRRKGVY